MGIVRKTTAPIITGSATPFTTTNNITQTGSINNSGDQTGKVYGTLNQPEIFVMYTGKDTETAKTTVDNENKKISVDLINKGYVAGYGIDIETHEDEGADIINVDLTQGANIQIERSGEHVVTISATDTTYEAGEHITIEDNVISAHGFSPEINIENGTGEGSAQMKAEGGAAKVNFGTGTDTDPRKNPHAYELDNSIDGLITYGATGQYATAFGGKDVAQGKRSLAEGTTTLAKGAYSHTEGDNTVALADASHAEGSTTVTGPEAIASHAEGYDTQTTGPCSHAEGHNTESQGIFAHAEGDSTHANGLHSHTEGYGTHADGEGAHAEGANNYAIGNYSHAEGAGTIANNAGSHAEGYCTVTNNDYQHVSGKYNDVKKTTLFEVGNGSGVSGEPTERSNAFEVYQDGHANVGAMGTEDLSVATKKYVDDTVETETVGRAVADLALSDRIDNLEHRGRFLSTWNATTGKPSTYPTVPAGAEYPYVYEFKAGDYYIIHNVPASNPLRPKGSSITKESATSEWTVDHEAETSPVSDNGTYTYDGTNWVLMGAGAAAAWGSIGGNIADQTDLNNTFVHKTGDETITGNKTFSNFVYAKLRRTYEYDSVGGSTEPFNYVYTNYISDGDAFADDENSGTTIKVSNIVDKNTTQTISGAKTFSNEVSLNGTTYLGGNSIYAKTIIPFDATRDLGTSAANWRDLYLSGELKDGTNSISIANIANKNDVVDKTTDQTIGGVKTFSSNPLVSGGSRLPSEYQEVEYIESLNAGCWIDTGVTPKQNIGIKVDYDPNSERRVFGVQENNQHILEFYDNRDGSIVYIWNAGGGYGISATTGRKIVFFNYNHDLKVRTSTHTAEGSLDSSMTFTYTKNLYLFNSNGLQSGYEFKGKIYDASITEDAGEIKHFIPCYRKSDNVIGMYDIIGGTFYTNQGTGSFTKGADVGVPVLLATQAWAQEKLPTVVNERYLHTDASGNLEWSEVAAGSTDRSSFIEGL